MKVFTIVFWPYHRVEEEETKPLLKTASKSDVGNIRTRLHAPAGWLPTRTDARHASSSPGWADPTRIPDDLTHVPDPDKDDVIMTPVYTVSMHASRHVSVQSVCHVSVQSVTHQRPVIRHVITMGPTWHVSSREPNHAEPSWAEPNWSRAVSRGIGSSVADPTCNRIWDWIWPVEQARIVLIKS
jgi:hypothetical protein